MKVYAFSGGGTGGHLMPGLALAAALRRENPEAEIHFVGSGRLLEQELVAKHGYVHLGLPVEPLQTARKSPWRFVSRGWRSYRMARRWLAEHRPRCVIGLGGYASAPLIVAARGQSIPTLILEQNLVPGRATRWLASRASMICVSFEETQQRLKGTVRVTGTPIRAEIAASSIVEPATGDPPVLLILGGSQGAALLNDAVLHAITRLDELRSWHIIHQAGAEHARAVRDRYSQLGLTANVEAFIDDMAACYRRATAVISRAGATTLAELACAGLPAILLPYPFAADDHQRRNAEYFARAGAARLVSHETDPAATAALLRNELGALMQSADRRREMRLQMRRLARPDATEQILQLLREFSG